MRCVIAAVLSVYSFRVDHAEAQLVGGQVAAGQATINHVSPTSTVINQQSQNAVINWQQFSIPRDSAVQFVQPNASSIALNNVTGGSASLIYGALKANGQVWLVNPNGIVIGPSAQITTAGVLLSTIGVKTQDFLAGSYNFDVAGNPNAAIVNEGRVVATSGGSVVMAAPQIRNDGYVAAELGTVVLAGAKAFTVEFAGDSLLSFAVTVPVDAIPVGANGLVDNTGTVSASGGLVLLTAATANHVLDNVINTTGIVEATSVQKVNGKIVLSASGGGTDVNGMLDASGTSVGETGGTVKVLGDRVTLGANARIDTRGDQGGGAVVVGGDRHGAGPDPNAQTTTVAAGATIDASAITRGNAGDVAVWSDGPTNYDGSIRARGGVNGGDGGFVETSGAQLWVTGTVDASAPRGHSGTWLLDPVSAFTICSSGCNDSPANIESGLSTQEVVVESNNDIILELGNPINYSSQFPLSLLAQGSIDLEDSIQNADTTDTTGVINLVAGWDGSTGLSGTCPTCTFSMTTLLGTPGSYGNTAVDAGSVTIGNGSETVAISVGSASATTSVAAASLTVQASSVTDSAGAQLGFSGGNASGDITVNVSGGVSLAAGTSGFFGADFAQIGHGGAFSQTDNTGNITIVAGGSVSLTGGNSSDDYAQIGHGGSGSDTELSPPIVQSGTISVTGSDISLVAGSGFDAYAQIGHGGSFANGTQSSSPTNVTMSGAINITTTSGALSLSSNGGTDAYVQIGHGGVTSVGENSGAITISSASDVTLSGGSGPESYAQIGHGGASTFGSNGSDIAVTVGGTGALVLSAGTGDVSYAQIGHGGYSSGASSGSILVNVAGGTASLTAGSTTPLTINSDYAMIGLGDAALATTADVTAGDVVVKVSGSMTLTPGVGGATFIGPATAATATPTIGSVVIVADSINDQNGAVQNFISQDLRTGDVTIALTGTTTTTVGRDVTASTSHGFTVVSAAPVDLNASIQNGLDGSITLVAGWDGFGIGATSIDVSGIISGGHYGVGGHGVVIGSGTQTGTVSVGSFAGATTVAAGGLTLNGSTGGSFAGAQLGYGSSSGSDASGAIVVDLLDKTGSAGNLVLTAGGVADFAQIGHNGAFSFGGTSNADITIDAAGSVTLTGGNGNDAYAQIGHGGFEVNAAGPTQSGNIAITAVNVTAAAGTGGDAYAQIGHGGAGSIYSPATGNIGLTLSGNLTLSGGTGTGANGSYAQVGHGGAGSRGDNHGTITIRAAGVALSGGNSDGNYAQIGFGGYQSTGSTSSGDDISVTTTSGDLALIGGSTGAAYVQVGHGDAAHTTSATGGLSGGITLTVAGTTFLATNTGSALIGHAESTGTGISGTVSLSSGSIVTSGGALEDSITADITAGAVSLASTGTGSFDLTSAFTYASTNPLTLKAGGDLTLPGITNTAAGAVTIDDPAHNAILTDGVTTAGGAITLTGKIVLAGNATIASPGAAIDLGHAIDATTAGAQSLTVNAGSAAVTIGGSIGAGTALGSVAVSGGSIDLNNNITTSAGAVAFTGPVVMSQAIAIDTTGNSTPSGASVTFNNTLDAAAAFDLNIVAGSSGTVTFAQNVGAGGQQLGNVTIAGTLGTLPSVFNVASLSLSSASGNSTFSGNSFVVNVPTIIGGTVSFSNSGGVAISGTAPLTLGSATTLDLSGPLAISGLAGLNGSGNALTINANANTVVLNGTFGGSSSPIGAFTVNNGASVNLVGSLTSNGNVNLAGGTVSLSGNLTTTGGSVSISAGTVVLSGTVSSGSSQFYSATNTVITGNATLTTPSGSIDFAGNISGSGSGTDNLTIDPPGQVSVGGSVGSPLPLGSFTVDAGTVVISGSVDVVNTLDLSGVTNTILQGPVFAGSITTGAVEFAGGTIMTSGGQNYGAAILDGDTALIVSPGGSAITFNSTIDSNSFLSVGPNLTIDDPGGTIVVRGGIGLNPPYLSSLTVNAASFSYDTIYSGITFNPGSTTVICGSCVPLIQDILATNPDLGPSVILQTMTPVTSIASLLQEILSLVQLGPIAGGEFVSPPLGVLTQASGPQLTTGGGEGGGSVVLTSVTDLDTGSQLFTEISPNSGGISPTTASDDPLVIIEPITPAPQPVPQPENAEEPLGGEHGTIYQYRVVFPQLPGVPGIDRASLGTGNRGLWFAPAAGAGGGP